MINSKNIKKHELIGLEVKVEKALNKDLIGLKGKVVDETKSLLIISTDKGEKKVLKAGVTFKIRLEKEWVLVEGDVLVGRPEDRIKK